MKLSEGKIKHMNALADKRGVIAAAAMDQRGSLQKSHRDRQRASSQDEVTRRDDAEFKVAVSKILTPHASAILLDPEFGLPAAKARATNAGLLLAYEESGYDNTQAGPSAGSAAPCFREAHCGLGRGRGEDPDLLHAFDDAGGERHQACVHRTHWRGVRVQRYSVLPGVRRLRSEGRR